MERTPSGWELARSFFLGSCTTVFYLLPAGEGGGKGGPGEIERGGTAHHGGGGRDMVRGEVRPRSAARYLGASLTARRLPGL